MESQLGKLYVGGLSWITTEDKLKEYFSKYGVIEESVIFLNVDSNYSNSFGYVVFNDPFVLSRVLQDIHYIDHHQLDVVPAQPVLGVTENSTTNLDESSIEEEEEEECMSMHQLTRGFKNIKLKNQEFHKEISQVKTRCDILERNQHKVELGRDFSQEHHTACTSGVGGENGIHKKKIFVGGLPKTLTNEKLIQYFERYGHVKEGLIRTDKLTKNSRKFAFVLFDTEDAVDKVLLHGKYHKLDNATVEVTRAIDKDKQQCNNNDSRSTHRENYNSSAVNANAPAGIGLQSSYAYPLPSYNYGPPNSYYGYNVNEFANSNVAFAGTAGGYYNPNVGYARGIPPAMQPPAMQSEWMPQNPTGYGPNVQWNAQGSGDTQSSNHWNGYGDFNG